MGDDEWRRNERKSSCVMSNLVWKVWASSSPSDGREKLGEQRCETAGRRGGWGDVGGGKSLERRSEAFSRLGYQLSCLIRANAHAREVPAEIGKLDDGKGGVLRTLENVVGWSGCLWDG